MTQEQFQPVLEELAQAEHALLPIFDGVVETGGLTREQHCRLLVQEYHREKGRHRHLFEAAAHPEIGLLRGVRKLFLDEAAELEPLYKVVSQDLRNLGHTIEPMPFEVELWWAYFSTTVRDRPFVSFGGHWILNHALERVNVAHASFFDRPFLPAESFAYTRRAKQLGGEGDRYRAVLSAADLAPRQLADLRDGIRNGGLLAQLSLRWVFGPVARSSHDLH